MGLQFPWDIYLFTYIYSRNLGTSKPLECIFVNIPIVLWESVMMGNCVENQLEELCLCIFLKNGPKKNETTIRVSTSGHTS